VNTSPLRRLHRAAGARFSAPSRASSEDERLLTYGDVPAEYEAGMRDALVFDATERGAVAVVGPDAETFLHRISANRVQGLEPGQGCRNLLLSGKGKVEHDFDLTRLERGHLLSTPPGRAAALLAALDQYLFNDDLTLEDRSEQHAPIEVCGPRAAEVIEKVLGAPPPPADHGTVWAELGSGVVAVTHLPVAGSPGWRLDAGPERVEALWRALADEGSRPGGLVVYDILRVEACRGEFGRDIDDTVYPQEARLEEAFDLDKGCYIGQEVVAKIDTYGGLNKRLAALEVDHDDPVAPGTRLHREQDGEWRDLGVVTSWAYSFVLDTGLVLGYVKRKHQEPGTTFRLGDGPAAATIVRCPVREGAACPPEGDAAE